MGNIVVHKHMLASDLVLTHLTNVVGYMMNVLQMQSLLVPHLINGHVTTARLVMLVFVGVQKRRLVMCGRDLIDGDV